MGRSEKTVVLTCSPTATRMLLSTVDEALLGLTAWAAEDGTTHRSLPGTLGVPWVVLPDGVQQAIPTEHVIARPPLDEHGHRRPCLVSMEGVRAVVEGAESVVLLAGRGAFPIARLLWHWALLDRWGVPADRVAGVLLTGAVEHAASSILMGPDALARQWSSRRRGFSRVEAHDLERGWTVWTTSDPAILAAALEDETWTLADVRGALEVDRGHYPRLRDGLVPHERRVLEEIAIEGRRPLLARLLDAPIEGRDPIMDWETPESWGLHVRNLCGAETPLVRVVQPPGEEPVWWYDRAYELTPLGRAVLAGDVHGFDALGHERRVGNVVLDASHRWAVDDDGRLIEL